MNGWHDASSLGRGGRGDGHVGEAGGEEWVVSDEGVMRTNDDATGAKLSCVESGYFSDEFVTHFVRQRGGRPARRPPLVNRGYYARYAAVRGLVHDFFAAVARAGLSAQVLNLGAGFDTLYFALKAAGEWPAGARMCELDFADVAHRKAAVVRRQPRLAALVEGAANVAKSELKGGLVLRGTEYALAGADLRDLDAVQAAAFEGGRLDARLPTLVLSECVLIYLPPDRSDALVAWAARAFSCAAMVVYEQIRPDDSFGRQMVQNIHDRGCPLLGIHAHPEPEDQERRFMAAGWTGPVRCLDMGQVYRRQLDPADLARIERLEIFDEFEEWDLIQAHYCIVVATVGGRDGFWDALAWFSAAAAAAPAGRPAVHV